MLLAAQAKEQEAVEAARRAAQQRAQEVRGNVRGGQAWLAASRGFTKTAVDVRGDVAGAKRQLDEAGQRAAEKTAVDARGDVDAAKRQLDRAETVVVKTAVDARGDVSGLAARFRQLGGDGRMAARLAAARDQCSRFAEGPATELPAGESAGAAAPASACLRDAPSEESDWADLERSVGELMAIKLTPRTIRQRIFRRAGSNLSREEAEVVVACELSEAEELMYSLRDIEDDLCRVSGGLTEEDPAALRDLVARGISRLATLRQAIVYMTECKPGGGQTHALLIAQALVQRR